jgi:hypothetical protein
VVTGAEPGAAPGAELPLATVVGTTLVVVVALAVVVVRRAEVVVRRGVVVRAEVTGVAVVEADAPRWTGGGALGAPAVLAALAQAARARAQAAPAAARQGRKRFERVMGGAGVAGPPRLAATTVPGRRAQRGAPPLTCGAPDQQGKFGATGPGPQ